MKQFISTNPASKTNPINKASDLGVEELRRAPIGWVYLHSLPPRGASLHGPSVEFFFPNGELAIGGEIVQIGPREEAFHLAFKHTLGLEYWRNEIVKPKGSSVAEATDLSEEWRRRGLDALLAGPRDVRLYTKIGPETMSGRLAAVEIIAKQAPPQRLLLVSSEDDPGDVIVLTPSDQYEQTITRLVALEQPGTTAPEAARNRITS
jgi:hypothetical protein